MAAPTDERSVDANGRARRDLINEAQIDVYRARQQCYRALSQAGAVPYEFRLNLQTAILDYYWALRPLHDDDPVSDWWHDVELSEHWRDNGDDEIVVDGDLFSPIEIDVDEREPEPLTGFDTLQELEEQVEQTTETTSTLRGEKTETTARPVVLSFVILRDISARLDDAAAKLGFAPETPAGELPTDKI